MLGIPMSPYDDVLRARKHLASGHLRRSLAAAWIAADAALRDGDADTLRAVIDIAADLQSTTDERVSRDAQRLAAYCQHSIDGAGGGIESHSILSRISRMGRARRSCPDCAERIPAEARVCRYCGFRLTPPEAPSQADRG
jgi:hypothetical protein